MHKAVTRHIETKKLLTQQKQSEYRGSETERSHLYY